MASREPRRDSSRSPNSPELDDPSPEQLAIRCQNGCHDSFEHLVHQFESRIFNYLVKMMGNASDAEDITQEAFLKAFRSIHRYDPSFPFANWLFTIAKRTAISFLRARRSTEELPADLAVDSPNPADTSSTAEDKMALWQQAKRLKPKQYEALWLRYGEGFSVAEVARIMQINVVYVKVLLHRARGQLAKRLASRPQEFQHG